MMKETDIFNDLSLQNDIQDLVAIEQGVLRANRPLPDLDAELAKVMANASGASQETMSNVSSNHYVILRTIGSALIGAVAMLALVLVWQWNKQDATSQPMAMNVETETGMATIQTAENEMITLTLADGTEVKLNGNSKITYPHQFKGKERLVQLSGEAFFKVKHDSQRPFVVDAGGVLTKDLGTSFNIKAYPQQVCKVTLVEGKVAIIAKQGEKKPIVLEPGQEFSVGEQASSSKVKEVDTEKTTAWADGVYYYHDESLEAVVKDLASHYQVGVDFRNQQARTLHLDFSTSRSGSLEEAVELLNGLEVAKVSVRKGTLVVE